MFHVVQGIQMLCSSINETPNDDHVIFQHVCMYQTINLIS